VGELLSFVNADDAEMEELTATEVLDTGDTDDD